MKKKYLSTAAVLVICAILSREYYVHEYVPGTNLIKLLTPFHVDSISNMKKRVGANNDGGYIVPLVAVKNSQAVMSYGIADDISFEMDIIKKFNLEVYGFDCGIKEAPGKHDKFHFYPECIASDNYIYKDQKSSLKVSSYNDQVKKLSLENKRIFIKMDIEGAEYESFEDIIDSLFENIQGIVIELHYLHTRENRAKAIKLLRIFDRYLVLIHVHGNNNAKVFRLAGKKVPDVIECAYISRKYVSSKQISRERFPTVLDRPNQKDSADIILDYWK
jgi:hypothetical protein